LFTSCNAVANSMLEGCSWQSHPSLTSTHFTQKHHQLTPGIATATSFLDAK